MKKISLFILLLLLASGLSAQSFTQALKGTVVDKQSQSPLSGATVILTASNPVIGAYTDDEGRFRLEGVPIGRQGIQISYVGYKNVSLSNLELSSAKEFEVRVEIEESITEVAEVVISAQDDKRKSINPLSTVSTRTFSIEEAGRYAGSLNDPARMAQNYAGVSGAADDRNDIIIRGNSPTGVLWRMEGIDIPSPNHFATLGTTGGPVSMLNINNLSNSDFMTSAWSADYGNALSGVFDLKLRNGNRDKREYLGQIGFNGFEFGAEGPFKKGGKASYLLNYRYSTLGLVDALGLNLGLGAAVPQYQDLTFKLNFPTEKSGTFSFWGLAGPSHIEFKGKDSDSTALFSDNTTDSKFKSVTGIFGASHTYFFNATTYTKFTLALSRAQLTGEIDSLSERREPIHVFGFRHKQNKVSAHLKFNKKLNGRNTFTAGVMYENYDIGVLDSVRRSNRFFRSADFDGKASFFQTYAQWQHRFSDKLKLNIGLHQQYFGLSESSVFEPRLGLKYDANDKHSFTFGAGMHSQIQPIVIYFQNDDEGNTLPNKSLDFSKSLHLVLGHDFLLNNSLRIKTELYYQALSNIPVDTFASSFSMLNTGTDFVLPDQTGLQNTGAAINYGLELTIEKFYSKGYYFLATASIFESKYKGNDKIERNTLFNGNTVFNVLGGKEFKLGKNKKIGFDTKLTFAGGRRYTPIDLEASRLRSREVRFDDIAFSEQYDDYFRLDFKVFFKMNAKNISQVWSVDIQNMTDKQNVFRQTYNTLSKNIETAYQRGRFPMVQYQIFF